jgi:hypothetical protein
MPEVSDMVWVHTRRRFEEKVPAVVWRMSWKEYLALISMLECFVNVLVIGEGTVESTRHFCKCQESAI